MSEGKFIVLMRLPMYFVPRSGTFRLIALWDFRPNPRLFASSGLFLKLAVELTFLAVSICISAASCDADKLSTSRRLVKDCAVALVTRRLLRRTGYMIVDDSLMFISFKVLLCRRVFYVVAMPCVVVPWMNLGFKLNAGAFGVVYAFNKVRSLASL